MSHSKKALTYTCPVLFTLVWNYDQVGSRCEGIFFVALQKSVLMYNIVDLFYCYYTRWSKKLKLIIVKESYPTNVHCARRYDQSPFSGPRKYGLYQYLQGIRFHRLIIGQNRLGFYKNNIWDHPTCFMHGYLRTFISVNALSSWFEEVL